MKLTTIFAGVILSLSPPAAYANLAVIRSSNWTCPPTQECPPNQGGADVSGGRADGAWFDIIDPSVSGSDDPKDVPIRPEG